MVNLSCNSLLKIKIHGWKGSMKYEKKVYRSNNYEASVIG